MKSDSPQPPIRRRGVMLVDVGVAVVLLTTLMGMLIPLLSRTAEKRKQIDNQDRALGSVANLLERAAVIVNPTSESLQPIAAQLSVDDELPSPEWKIVITPEQNPSMNRVEATLSWQSRPLVRHSVTLVRWYRGEQP